LKILLFAVILHATIVFVAVTCQPAQVNPSNGAVSCTNGNMATSICTFSCSPGYDMIGSQTTTCLDDEDGDALGVWTNTRPFCIRKFVTTSTRICLFRLKTFLRFGRTLLPLVPLVKWWNKFSHYQWNLLKLFTSKWAFINNSEIIPSTSDTSDVTYICRKAFIILKTNTIPHKRLRGVWI